MFEYGEKCIFLCDNMSKECQDVPDNVEVKVIFVRENFHTGTFLFEKGHQRKHVSFRSCKTMCELLVKI